MGYFKLSEKCLGGAFKGNPACGGRGEGCFLVFIYVASWHPMGVVNDYLETIKRDLPGNLVPGIKVEY